MSRIWNLLIVLTTIVTSCRHAQPQIQNREEQATEKQRSIPLPDDPLYELGEESEADSIAPDYMIPKFFRVMTTDRIYYKGKCYRPMLSPLQGRIADFDKFFPFLPAIAAQFEPGGGMIDKRYTLVWLLVNDRLYLANVEVDSHMHGRTQEEMNAMMEQYLGARFQKNIPVGDSTGLDLRFGLMPTEWLDGSIFVRQRFDTRPQESEDDEQKRFQEWESAPFQELIFKKGRLLHVINRENAKDKKSVIDPALLRR